MYAPVFLSGTVLFAAVLCFGAEETKLTSRPTEKTTASQPATDQRLDDEAAIRQADASFLKAYIQGDAESAAALFTPDAEYVDELGNVFQGRAAIEESLAAFFAKNPGCKLEMNIDTIRFISSGVAVEDGSTRVTLPESEVAVDSRYTTVYVKTDGKWLVASVRDHAPRNRREHHAQLQQLQWLVGDWVDEGDDSIVTFSCQPADHGNFLLRTFTIRTAGHAVMSGTQRIGWDPLTSKLRTWIFDSEGAYGEGLWHRDGENWVLKTSGVTADGQMASSTSIYTFVNEHTMTWQSVDHEIAGVQQPDSEVVTIVRQAPAPAQAIVDDRQ
ncbi:MAG: SgcJ/EcaC family oxidoreductase [Rhodopirellula sp.]|nr:SgcJ/EcaC family oxidoreductase [Rhodopirellula sp.]